MLRRRFLALFVLALSFGWITSAQTRGVSSVPSGTDVSASKAKQWKLDETLPLDPAIRTGKFANGLTYYIKRNQDPRDRGELRLVVNAGSNLEDNDQRGLAHFLEHMLFNGTKHFQKHDLVDFLESIGLRFGPDLNAYTSFDETVYMLKVPTDKKEILVKAFDILQDWADAATLSQDEIDKERGVVIEEWRLGQGAQGRLRDKLIPAIFAGSRYKDRLPIGDPEIIRHAPREALVRFYKDWYRPDLMAVIAVGDFDVDQVEALVRERFEGLKNPVPERERPVYKLPVSKDTTYTVVTDKELPVTQVQVFFKQPEEESFKTVADYRRILVRGLFEGMINERLAEIAQSPSAPFLAGQIGSANLVRAGQTYVASAVAKEGHELDALASLLTEVARVREHGFTASELERQKAELLRSYERMYEERNNSNSAGFAAELVRNFLEGEPAPGIPAEYELANQLVPGITLEQVDAVANKLIRKEDRVVVVAMPDKPGLKPPTDAELATVLEKVEATDVKPFEDKTVNSPLVSQKLKPVSIRSRRQNAALGVTEVVLKNGIRILMKPTDFKKEQVLFSAFSPGGTSLVPDKQYFDAVAADTLVSLSGVGAFDAVALQKKLAGKSADVSPSIGEISEGMSGVAATKDIETLLQLVYLYFTEPRADASALSVYIQQRTAMLQNLLSTPEGVFQKAMLEAMYGDYLRRRIPTVAEVQSTNLQDAIKIYKARFADADDFTFLFVGSFDEAKLLDLCERYLGNLPVKPGKEAWKDVSRDLPDGVVKRVVKKGTDPQSRVALVFHGPFVYNRENRFAIRMMAEVLNIKLREELREDLGGVYGVSVSASPTDRPDPRYQLRISFSCDPARVEELTAAAMKQIEWIKHAQDMDKYLQKVREQEKRSFESSLRQNSFWLSTIQFYYERPNEDPTQLMKLPELVDSIGAPEIRKAAEQYLDTNRYIDVALYPENFEIPSGNRAASQ
ncbi:MAG: insulinase family protein [Bryobacterales bacterium]|nr:insulinase family protein [Bryobacterales bacterium]